MLSRRNALLGSLMLLLFRRRSRRKGADTVEVTSDDVADGTVKSGGGRLRKLFRLLVTGASVAGAVWFKKRRSGGTPAA